MTADPVAAARREKSAYVVHAGDEDRPLGSFLVLMGAYGAAVAGLAGLVAARGARLPERVDLADLALLAVATHKVSRTLAKDPVTSPLRAPFTRFRGQSGEAELAEEPRESGPRKAVGELVTCPFCLGQWVATGLAFGLVLAPRATRLAPTTMTALTLADALQFAYAKLEEA